MARWIKIYDGLLDWGWHTRPEMVSLFVHLLLKANIKDGHFEGFEVKRGQLVTSRKELSILTGISEQSIRTCINHLKNTGEIAIKSTKRFSIITICKYDSYQAKKESANQPTNQQPTNNQPTPNQRLTTSIEYKKEEYKREDINKPSSSLSSSPWAELTPAEQKEEKSLFFEIFFFKNYNQLNEEVDRFVAANNSTLWTRGNGKPYATRAQRVALAELWKQKPAQDPRIRINGFLTAWKRCYERCKSESPDIAKFFLNPRTTCETSRTVGHDHELMVRARKEALDWLAQDDDHREMLLGPLRMLAQAYGKEEIKFYNLR